ncbi:NADPH-dependent F420 reductase [Leifsonia sp. NPDC058194]|uniref:NADPH-dependent F420 reductase n=1 Tax=Leifsonia sp. NPDC058194 TaxID=3346374 RepID=UPI0036DF1932
MTIGILGTGAMTVALGRRFVETGHEVVIGSRDPQRARAVALAIGAADGVDHRAAARADIVIVAVQDSAALELVGALAAVLRGRVLVDLGNPIDPPHFESRYGAGPSLAERMAEAAPGARVVKAFNTVYAELLEAGRPVQVFVASDDDAAKDVVAGLVTAIGCEPFDVGPLRVSRHLERLAGFEVDLVERGYAGATAAQIVDLRR